MGSMLARRHHEEESVFEVLLVATSILLGVFVLLWLACKGVQARRARRANNTVADAKDDVANVVRQPSGTLLDTAVSQKKSDGCTDVQAEVVIVRVH